MKLAGCSRPGSRREPAGGGYSRDPLRPHKPGEHLICTSINLALLGTKPLFRAQHCDLIRGNYDGLHAVLPLIRQASAIKESASEDGGFGIRRSLSIDQGSKCVTTGVVSGMASGARNASAEKQCPRSRIEQRLT